MMVHERPLCAPTVGSLEFSWLSDMDSNHEKRLQRALCYHYTIGQTGNYTSQPDFLTQSNFR